MALDVLTEPPKWPDVEAAPAYQALDDVSKESLKRDWLLETHRYATANVPGYKPEMLLNSPVAQSLAGKQPDALLSKANLKVALPDLALKAAGTYIPGGTAALSAEAGAADALATEALPRFEETAANMAGGVMRAAQGAANVPEKLGSLIQAKTGVPMPVSPYKGEAALAKDLEQTAKGVENWWAPKEPPPEILQSIDEARKTGDYSGVGRMLVNFTASTAPWLLEGVAPGGPLLFGTTAGGQKLQRLDAENPTMPEGTKDLDAVVTGATAMVAGHVLQNIPWLSQVLKPQEVEAGLAPYIEKVARNTATSTGTMATMTAGSNLGDVVGGVGGKGQTVPQQMRTGLGEAAAGGLILAAPGFLPGRTVPLRKGLQEQYDAMRTALETADAEKAVELQRNWAKVREAKLAAQGLMPSAESAAQQPEIVPPIQEATPEERANLQMAADAQAQSNQAIEAAAPGIIAPAQAVAREAAALRDRRAQTLADQAAVARAQQGREGADIEQQIRDNTPAAPAPEPVVAPAPPMSPRQSVLVKSLMAAHNDGKLDTDVVLKALGELKAVEDDSQKRAAARQAQEAEMAGSAAGMAARFPPAGGNRNAESTGTKAQEGSGAASPTGQAQGAPGGNVEAGAGRVRLRNASENGLGAEAGTAQERPAPVAPPVQYGNRQPLYRPEPNDWFPGLGKKDREKALTLRANDADGTVDLVATHPDTGEAVVVDAYPTRREALKARATALRDKELRRPEPVAEVPPPTAEAPAAEEVPVVPPIQEAAPGEQANAPVAAEPQATGEPKPEVPPVPSAQSAVEAPVTEGEPPPETLPDGTVIHRLRGNQHVQLQTHPDGTQELVGRNGTRIAVRQGRPDEFGERREEVLPDGSTRVTGTVAFWDKDARELVYDPRAMNADSQGDISHEVVHIAKTLGAVPDALWRRMEALAMQEYGIDGVKAIREEYAKAGRELTDEQLREEALARKIQDWAREGKPNGDTRTFAQKFIDFMRDLGHAFGVTQQGTRSALEGLYRGEPFRGEGRAAPRTEAPRGEEPMASARSWRKGDPNPANHPLIPLPGGGFRPEGIADRIRTPEDYRGLQDLIRALGKEGAIGKYWYKNSAHMILRITNGDRDEAVKFAGVLACYSPLQEPGPNVTAALKAWYQYKQGGVDAIHGGLGTSRENAKRFLTTGELPSGPKVGAFYQNLKLYIKGASTKPSTIDMWMSHIFGYRSDMPGGKGNAFAQREMAYLAKEMGILPLELQAEVWIAVKARMEKVRKEAMAQSIAKGWAVRVKNEDGSWKKGKGEDGYAHEVRPEAEHLHNGNWLDLALSKKAPTAAELKSAAYDFQDALKERTAQVSFEAYPGEKSGLMEWLKTATPEQLEWYAKKATPIARDIFRKHGVLVSDIRMGPASWEGKTRSGGLQAVVHVPFGSDGRITPEARKSLNAACAELGLTFTQDSVAYHAAVTPRKTLVAENNGTWFSLGRSLTTDEAREFSQHLANVLREQNDPKLLRMFGEAHAGWAIPGREEEGAPRIPTAEEVANMLAPIDDEDGVSVVWFTRHKWLDFKSDKVGPFAEHPEGDPMRTALAEDAKSALKDYDQFNRAMHELVEGAAERTSWAGEIKEHGRYTSDGELISGGADGRGYGSILQETLSERQVARLTAGESSDLQAWRRGNWQKVIAIHEEANRLFNKRGNVVPVAARSAGAGTDVPDKASAERLAAGRQPWSARVIGGDADRLEEPVQVSHWGRPGLRQTYPRFYGSGKSGAENIRRLNDPRNWVDRTYFGGTRYNPEQGLGKTHYDAHLDKSKIVDLLNPPERAKAIIRACTNEHGILNATLMEKRFKAAGYDGYYSPTDDVYAVFHRVAVREGGGERLASVRTWDKLKEEGVRDTVGMVRGIHAFVNGIPTRRDIAQFFDATINHPVVAGQQTANSLQLGQAKESLSAVFPVIESGRDRSKLAEFRAKVEAGIRKFQQENRTPPTRYTELLDDLTYADRHWDELQPLADKAQAAFDRQIHDEWYHGIDTKHLENYAGSHLYDMDWFSGHGRPYLLFEGRGSGASGSFRKGRTFATVYDAVEQGYVPKSLDVAALAEHRVKAGQKLIALKEWAKDLESFTDPVDGQALTKPIVYQRQKDGTVEATAPMGYQLLSLSPGNQVAIHEAYAGLFKGLTDESHMPQGLLKTEGFIKHGMLLFDTFHASRIMQKQMTLTGGKVSYRKGDSLLEYADRDLDEAVHQGVITQEMADYARANRGKAEALLRNGFNVGRVTELLYEGPVRRMQDYMAGKAKQLGVPKGLAEMVSFNRWVFDKVTRGAMLESGLIEMDRVQRANPRMSQDEVAKKVARDLNVLFGSIGHQGAFKSATMMDLMRLGFLAPQWVESMARTEAGAAGQAANATIHGRNPLSGSLAKSMGVGLAAYVVGTQLINLATRGYPTWKNREKEHRMDAWTPDITGKTNGFFLNPMSVFAELSHDMLRYTLAEHNNPLAAAGHILLNKASPLARAGIVGATGYTPNREKVRGALPRVQAALGALVPVPIPLSATLKGSDYPGQIQRQATASAGIKTEPAMGDTARLHKLADEWNQAHNLPPGPEITRYAGEGYHDLASALFREDSKAALEHLGILRQQIPDANILKHFKNAISTTYTGRKQTEAQFRASLDEQDKQAYLKAMQEKLAAFTRLAKVMREHPR